MIDPTTFQTLGLIYNKAAAAADEIIAKGDIVDAVRFFDELREDVRRLTVRVDDLQHLVDSLSHEILPTLFTNRGIKTINIEGVGRTTVNASWHASMIGKAAGFAWLRSTGNDGLIIETVNANTLAAFAKAEALEGRPLPSEIFKVFTKPYISITSKG